MRGLLFRVAEVEGNLYIHLPQAPELGRYANDNWSLKMLGRFFSLFIIEFVTHYEGQLGEGE